MVRKVTVTLCCLCLLVVGGYYMVNGSFCKKDSNPLLDVSFYDNIDFSSIKDTDFEPAVDQGIKIAREEIQAIIDNKEEPTFVNTVVALDQSGFLMNRAAEIFFHLTHAASNPTLEEAEAKISEKLAAFSDEILYNKDLFKKIKYVYNNKDRYDLDDVDKKLLEDVYSSYIKEGIDLDEATQTQLKEINKKLTALSTEFSQNLIKQAREFEYSIPEDQGSRFDGVPASSIQSFKKDAESRGKSGYVLTYINPEVTNILKYAKDRSLREEVYKMNRAKGKELNSGIVVEMMNLRLQKAKLLGFKNHAEYVLKNNSMADNPDRALNLINSILPKSLSALKKDQKIYEDYARKVEKDKNFKLNIWDWMFYAEKVREDKYSYNAEELKPYFELTRVRDGVIGALNKLYGVSFKKNDNLPLYYKDDNNGIDSFEVFDRDGSYLGILYLDYFARAGKKAGAWSTSIRTKYSKLDNGKLVGFVPPVEVVVFNFSSNPTDGSILLNMRDVETLFHEVGHAINAFFIEPKYNRLAGSYRDFVELPSQIFENWAFDEGYLPQYGKHYKTGESIPMDVVKKINASDTFDKGYFVSRQLFLGLEDLGWHTMEQEYSGVEADFEEPLLKSKGLEPEYDYVPRTYQFYHVMSTGYDARYYSYMWSDMLVADAFSVFKEKGIFNQEVAASFRKNILSIASTTDPNVSYRKFRGKDPEIRPLLKKFGFIK